MEGRSKRERKWRETEVWRVTLLWELWRCSGCSTSKKQLRGTSTVKSKCSVRLCCWSAVVDDSVQNVWCWRRRRNSETRKAYTVSEPIVKCWTVPSKGVFTNSLPLPDYHQWRQTVCHKSSENCRLKNVPHTKSYNCSWVFPFVLKYTEGEIIWLYDAFYFGFSVSNCANICFQTETSVWDLGTRVRLPPLVWISDGVMK